MGFPHLPEKKPKGFRGRKVPECHRLVLVKNVLFFFFFIVQRGSCKGTLFFLFFVLWSFYSGASSKQGPSWSNSHFRCFLPRTYWRLFSPGLHAWFKAKTCFFFRSVGFAKKNVLQWLHQIRLWFSDLLVVFSPSFRPPFVTDGFNGFRFLSILTEIGFGGSSGISLSGRYSVSSCMYSSGRTTNSSRKAGFFSVWVGGFLRFSLVSFAAFEFATCAIFLFKFFRVRPCIIRESAKVVCCTKLNSSSGVSNWNSLNICD